MPTDNSTLHSLSPTTSPGSHQRPPHGSLHVLLITALVLLLVLLAAGGLAWQFLVSPRLSCIQAADPTRTGAATEYCLPGNDRNYGAMTVGPDGNLWFTDSGKIARITAQGVITEFTVPTQPTAVPLPGIAGGPDGNLWFIAGTKLGRISPQGRFVGAVAMPSRVWYITGLTAAPDGTLWVGLSTVSETDQLTHEIARVTASGEVIAAVLPGPVAPTGGLVAGADGNVWFSAEPSTIARITPSGAVTRFTLPHDRDITAITSGPDGGVWFLLVDSDVLPFVINSTRVVRITP
jgi:streptogramin lyase